MLLQHHKNKKLTMGGKKKKSARSEPCFFMKWRNRQEFISKSRSRTEQQNQVWNTKHNISSFQPAPIWPGLFGHYLHPERGNTSLGNRGLAAVLSEPCVLFAARATRFAASLAKRALALTHTARGDTSPGSPDGFTAKPFCRLDVPRQVRELPEHGGALAEPAGPGAAAGRG